MSPQAVQCDETLGAFRALVWTLARVRADVHVQVTLSGEALATVGTGVRRLTCVRPSVEQQLPGRQKRLPARGAQIISLPFVHLHVSRDAAFAETLPADCAQVAGAFVQLLMLLEGIIAQESLLALATDKFASSLVDPLVLIISRQAGEALLALDAAVREAVELHVNHQLIRKLENLVTLRAFGFLLCKVLGHWSCAQEPFVQPCGCFLLMLFLVFQVLLLLLEFLLVFSCASLFWFYLFPQVAFDFLFIVFRFLCIAF